ncbi:hypothetical protein LTR28_011081, partial [Elasticomyces elasticus]
MLLQRIRPATPHDALTTTNLVLLGAPTISLQRDPLYVQQDPFSRSKCSAPIRLSSSSTRWKSRQSRDSFARDARVQGLKSRAAFKLLELDAKHRLFKPRQTVIDLGYAPGSWSQVAVSRTAPEGRVVGIDVIPAQPPRGASSIQGNFLSESVQAEVRRYVQDPMRGRPRRQVILSQREDGAESEEDVREMGRGYVEMERHAHLDGSEAGEAQGPAKDPEKMTQKERDDAEGMVVDVVLSDMSAPWEQTTGMWIRSVSDPYYRMMNTSGMPFRDHAGSM